MNQKRIKKEELKTLFKNENLNDNLKIENKINDKDYIEFELSNGEIIKEQLSTLKKFPNSILSAAISGKILLPKRNGHYFLDRNPQDFKLLLYYLKKSKLPKFQNPTEEKIFFNELNFWRIPIKISNKKTLQFDNKMCASCFNINKSQTILTKMNSQHGIVLLNITLNALTPYFEFNLCLNNPFCTNKKFYIALVDKKKFEKNYLNNTFESGKLPFHFCWDVYRNKIFKKGKNGNDFKYIEFEKLCQCFLNNYETKFGIMYEQEKHSVKLYRNDCELDIEIQNIPAGLVPAIELHMEECKIQLSSNTEKQEIFYL